MSEHDSTRKYKYTYLEPTFICTSCKKLRDHEIREKGRNRCLICSGYRKHKARVNTKTFQEFEDQFFESKRLQSIGKFKCSGCNQELDQSLNNQGKGSCRPCNLESKRQRRAREAKENNKHFIPRASHSAHVEEYKKTFVLDSHYVAYIKSFIHDAHYKRYIKENSKKYTNKHKYKGMTDQEVKEHFDTIGQPWNNPRITPAEKYRIKYHNNPEFKLKELLKSRMKRVFKRRDIDFKIRKSIRENSNPSNVFDLLYYTKEELMQSMESKFTDGMNWDRFMNSEIHIDHILPVGLFNMDSEVNLCWSLDNLQPLWAKDNINKSDRLPDGRLMRRLNNDEREEARSKYIFNKINE